MSASAPVGSALPAREVLVRAERMAVVSALMDDPVPVHYDRSAVQAAGLGDRLINQGPLALGYLAEIVRDWTGPAGEIDRLRGRFLAAVLEGDRLVGTGTVVAVDPAARTTTVELALLRGGEAVARGSARVRWTSAAADPAEVRG